MFLFWLFANIAWIIALFTVVVIWAVMFLNDEFTFTEDSIKTKDDPYSTSLRLGNAKKKEL